MEHYQENKITEKKALSRMMRICSRKEYCTFDIKQKLYRLNLSSEESERIITELQKHKFIDDVRYTRSYINDKISFSKWGLVKIRYSLKLKQIPHNIMNEVLEEIEPELLTDQLLPIIKQKMESVKANSEYEKRNKVIRFALSRGFEMTDIIKCIDKTSTSNDITW